MEQLSTIIQVVGSLITLVILPLLLLRSKKKKADAEAEKTEADNITAYAAEWKELYEKKEKRVVELDAKIDHLYAEITKYRDAIRELSEKNSELAVQNQALEFRKCNIHGCADQSRTTRTAANGLYGAKTTPESLQKGIISLTSSRYRRLK